MCVTQYAINWSSQRGDGVPFINLIIMNLRLFHYRGFFRGGGERGGNGNTYATQDLMSLSPLPPSLDNEIISGRGGGGRG